MKNEFQIWISMFSYYEKWKSIQFVILCLNFSIEAKTKTLFLIWWFNLSKKWNDTLGTRILILQFNMRHPKEFSFLLKSWLVETKSRQKNELNKLNYCYIGIYINCINISGKHFHNKYVTFKEKDRKHIFVNSSSEDCVHRLFYVNYMVRTKPDSQILSYKLYSTS